MSEHFRVGIQMAGEIARAALPAEFSIESLDELLQGRLRRGAQDRRYQISPFDFIVTAGVAHLGEMRLSGFLLAGTQGPVRLRASRSRV